MTGPGIRLETVAAWFCALLLVAFVAGPAAAGGGDAPVVFLVRHAEKAATGQDDPPLADRGRDRAGGLARLLGPAGITAVYSTDYRRTMDTARPTAEALGLEIQLYDPNALEDFADRLKRSPGRMLVVGHSNTTPALVEHLGGEGGAPIDESTEYDRLYIVIPGLSARTVTIRQRYGPDSR